jgi:hypothetical protein
MDREGQLYRNTEIEDVWNPAGTYVNTTTNSRGMKNTLRSHATSRPCSSDHTDLSVLDSCAAKSTHIFKINYIRSYIPHMRHSMDEFQKLQVKSAGQNWCHCRKCTTDSDYLWYMRSTLNVVKKINGFYMKNELNLIDFLKLLHSLQYWSYYDFKCLCATFFNYLTKQGNGLLSTQRAVRYH